MLSKKAFIIVFLVILSAFLITGCQPPTTPTAYTITATSGVGGSIAPAGVITITEGEDKTFTITPDADYQIAYVIVDGVSAGAQDEYTFQEVTEDHTIFVTFEAIPSTSPPQIVIVIPVAAVSLTPPTMSLTTGGATGTLTETITPANANNKNVNWSSSDSGIATVANGLVTPLAEGTVTITVTTVDGSFTATCTVTVITTTPEVCFTFDALTKTITDYNPALGGIDVVIPSMIGGDAVEHIGDNAFNNNALTSVIIPDSVTTIGAGAFALNQLTSVTIPDSITTIGDLAFQDNQLTSVTIPDSVTTISDYAFASNQLTSVTIPDSITTIGVGAFYDNLLISVAIGASVDIDANLNTMGTNMGFKTVYDAGAKLAGIYNYTGVTWVKVI